MLPNSVCGSVCKASSVSPWSPCSAPTLTSKGVHQSLACPVDQGNDSKMQLIVALYPATSVTPCPFRGGPGILMRVWSQPLFVYNSTAYNNVFIIQKLKVIIMYL